MTERLYGPLEDRLLARLDFTDGCWEWTGAHSPEGYGRVRIQGKTNFVHRLVVEWAQGRTLTTNEQVDHLCRNRLCARPTHLEVVSNMVNGQRGQRAKLTARQVQAIRRARLQGVTLQALATRYGIHHSHVLRICRGDVWKNVRYPRINPWASRWHPASRMPKHTTGKTRKHRRTDRRPSSMHEASRTENAFEVCIKPWRHNTCPNRAAPESECLRAYSKCSSLFVTDATGMLLRSTGNWPRWANVLSLPRINPWASRTHIVTLSPRNAARTRRARLEASGQGRLWEDPR